MSELNRVLHAIITKLDIHAGDREELHKQVDAAVEPEKEDDDGGQSGNSTNGAGR